MPIYEYRCLECKEKFEEYQDMSDDSVITCKKCGGKTKKLISLSSSEAEMDAHTYYENVIMPEVRQIVDKIQNGDENTAADIFGEGK